MHLYETRAHGLMRFHTTVDRPNVTLSSFIPINRSMNCYLPLKMIAAAAPITPKKGPYTGCASSRAILTVD